MTEEKATTMAQNKDISVETKKKKERKKIKLSIRLFALLLSEMYIGVKLVQNLWEELRGSIK